MIFFCGGWFRIFPLAGWAAQKLLEGRRMNGLLLAGWLACCWLAGLACCWLAGWLVAGWLAWLVAGWLAWLVAGWLAWLVVKKKNSIPIKD